MISFAGDSHPGRIRSNNEDIVGWAPERGIWLVADGMGGHAGGEVASQIVCDTLLAEGQDGSLEKSVCDAHHAIMTVAGGDPTLNGMGSTVVALEIIDGIARVVWVGDSRAYLWRGNALSRISRDHSFLELLRERDDISETQLRNHPNRNIVTQTLGLGDPNPSTKVVLLRRGDRILLCSDGLNDELTDLQIADILRADDTPGAAVRQLIDTALDKGGRDNVSIVIVAYDGTHNEWYKRLWRRLTGRRKT